MAGQYFMPSIDFGPTAKQLMEGLKELKELGSWSDEDENTSIILPYPGMPASLLCLRDDLVCLPGWQTSIGNDSGKLRLAQEHGKVRAKEDLHSAPGLMLVNFDIKGYGQNFRTQLDIVGATTQVDGAGIARTADLLWALMLAEIAGISFPRVALGDGMIRLWDRLTFGQNPLRIAFGKRSTTFSFGRGYQWLQVKDQETFSFVGCLQVIKVPLQD